MIETQLKQLGLSTEEANIYLMLLKYGTSNVSQISRITKIGRVNCYHYIEKLLQQGLISKSQKHKVNSYSAENPKIFLNQGKARLNLIETLVPQLLAITSFNPSKPNIQLFEGKEGIKNIFEAMIQQQNQEIVSFSNLKTLGEFLPDFLPQHFSQRFEKNIKTRFISPWTEEADDFENKFFPNNYPTKLSEIFLTSAEDFSFVSEISIFAGSIAIMNLNEHNPIGILIENSELYKTQKAIFDLAWLGATSFITR
ncbi:hypothetical protein CSB37_03345 [bacterium DOLZORAL124_38_8]|nr:MAG: hypothetical protein CSB37_03345 [bacterium DOLZORAL124_38_8]